MQSGGRVKPLDTYARETARAITGRESLDGMSAMELLFTLCFKGESLADTELLKIGFDPFKERAGLDPKRQRFSYRELLDNRTFLTMVEQVREKQHAGMGEDLDRLEREVSNVYGRLVQMSMLMGGEEPHLVPTPGEHAAVAVGLPGGVGAGDRRLDHRSLGGDAGGVHRRQRERVHAGEPGPPPIVSPGWRRRAIPIPSASRSRCATTAGSRIGSPRSRTCWPRWASFSDSPSAAAGSTRPPSCMLLAGFAVQTYGLAVRTILTGRAPVGNMYEALIFIGWGLVGLAIFLEAMSRTRIFGATAGIAGFIVLVLAHYLPLDPAISPLVAVLNATWLQYHVTTILFGDAALTLAAAVAHFIMFATIFAPQRGGSPEDRLAAHVSRDPGRRLVSGGRDHLRRHLGQRLLGSLLGMGSQGDLGAHHAHGLPGRVARPAGGLAAGARDGAGHRLEPSAPGDDRLRRELLPRRSSQLCGGEAGVQLPPLLIGYLIFEAILVAGYILAWRRIEGRAPAARVKAPVAQH